MLLSLILIMLFGTGSIRKEDGDLHWPCLPVQRGGEEHHPAQKGTDRSAKTFSPTNPKSFEQVRGPLPSTLKGSVHLLATIMATKQRLRAVLDVRRASRLCSRCALNLSRYKSTSAINTNQSSKSVNTARRIKGVDSLPSEMKCFTITKFHPVDDPHVRKDPLPPENSTEKGKHGVSTKPIRPHLAMEDPVGGTALVPKKKPKKKRFRLKHKGLAPLIRTHISRPARKPKVLEGGIVRKITLSSDETQKQVIPRKVIDNTLEMRRLVRDATEVSSEVRGEDEPYSDEVTSLLDELDGLVSQNTPDVTTKTGFSQSSPHSSPQYSAKPPASSWKPTLTRQSLEYSNMSFSTWSRKAAKRCYATAAVSKH